MKTCKGASQIVCTWDTRDSTVGMSEVTKDRVVALTEEAFFPAPETGADREKGEEKEFSKTRVLSRCRHFVEVSTTVVKNAFSTRTLEERVMYSKRESWRPEREEKNEESADVGRLVGDAVVSTDLKMALTRREGTIWMAVFASLSTPDRSTLYLTA